MAIRELEGHAPDSANARIGIVVARFNDVITKKLLEGALDVLRKHGVPEAGITVAWTPGSFELPLVAQEMARSGRYDAIIALGCVVKGKTHHFDLVINETARGIAEIGRQYRLPVMFEVLAVEDIEVALDRAGRKLNRGSEAAEAALEMVALMRRLRTELG